MDDPLSVGATVLTVAVALAIPVVWGGLQGAGRFAELSGAHVLFAGTRLAVGLAIALAGGSVGAVMIGVACATMVTLVISALPIRWLFLAGRGAARLPLATRANAGAALGLTALWALAYGDVLVARLAFSGDEAGAVRRCCRRVEGALARAHRGDDRPLPSRRSPPRPHPGAATPPGGSRRSWLPPRRSSTARRAGSSRSRSSTCCSAPEYEAADAWLGPLCLAMALYGLAIVYLYHFLARAGNASPSFLSRCWRHQMVAYALLHDEPSQLIGAQIAFGVSLPIACETWYHLRR